MELAFAFTGAQINLIIFVAIFFAAAFAGSVAVLVALFYKRKKSKLCTEELQRRREELLEELNQLRLRAAAMGMQAEDLDDEEEASDVDYDEEDSDVEDDVDSDEAVETDASASFNAEILAVRDMSNEMRVKYGFVGDDYNLKRYYVRPSYSFKARLCRANYDTRARYEAIANAFCGISKAKTKRSFRQERVYLGRKTIALILFKGKKLCVALALNPDDYADTKYKGIDVSDKKRFAAVPMMLKLTSPRKADYAVYLIEQLAISLGAEFDSSFKAEYDFTQSSREQLFADGDVKYAILGEATQLEEEDVDDEASDVETVRAGVFAVNDMSSYTRTALGFNGRDYDDKRYYVRYGYGFNAKLRNSDEEVKERYLSLLSEANCYKRLAVKESFRGIRLSLGRKTLGQIVFKGKTLCIALALNPNAYADTKYRGIDVSDTKRFAKTPMLLKLTSARRLGYAKYLLTKLADEHGLEPHYSQTELKADLAPMDVNRLFEAGLLKINVIGRAPDVTRK